MNQLETFIQNFQHENQIHGVSNVYVLETYNRAGERTDQCFGMNLMTDLGFIQRYSQGVDFPTNLYVGNGTDESFSKSSNVLMSVLFNGTPAVVEDKTRNHAIPMFYSKGESTGDGIITTLCRFLKASYNYTISGVSEDTLITEYGIGTAYNQLWTHSFVYDIKGQKTTITKKQNEKLVIHVYLCCSYYENLITDNWVNGIYPMITTNQYMFRRLVPSNVYTYKRNNIKQPRTIQQTTFSKVENSTITNTTTLSNFTMTNGTTNDTGYFDGWALYDDGFVMFEPQYLDTPEAFVLENLIADLPSDIYGFSQKFGASAEVPFTQLDITSVKAFNAKTKTWDVPLSYYNDPTRIYDETSMQTTFVQSLCYSNKINYNDEPDKWFDNVIKMYVYQNLYPDNPIVEIDTSAATLYAAEKYWDKDTWVEITDFKNIPEQARSYRYWITNVNNSNLNPTRERKPFHLKTLDTDGTSVTGYDSYPTFKQYNSDYYQNYSQCDNYEYGWYLKGDRVFVPKNGLTFKTNTISKYTKNYTYGKWLIVIAQNATSLLVFDMNNVQTSSTPPTATAVTLPFTSTTVNLYKNTETTITESCTGILCFQSGNESCILDMRGDTIATKKIDARKSCAIYGKEQIAYIPTDAAELRVYDVTADADIRSTALPNTTIPVTMVAHTNYVWFTDCSSYEYVANIQETVVAFDEVVTTSGYLPNGNGGLWTTCVDDVILIYEWSTKDVSKAVYFTLDDVKTQKRIPTSFVENVTNIYENYATCFYFRYVENNVLMLMITATCGTEYARSDTIDFGQYLATGNVFGKHYSLNKYGSFTLLGKFIILQHYLKTLGIAYLPIRIEGTTKTVTANTYIKNIENKSFAISYTNEPVFLGVPPGKQS